MKVNELTIGDLVYVYTLPNEKPQQEDLMVVRLVGVNSDEIDENPIPFCEGRILSTNGIFSRPIDTLVPIPLTEEILKLNGFIHKETMEEWWHEEYDPVWGMRMSDFELTDEFNFGRAKLTYVHELQHALRLCGLNDLADNFKVTE